MCKKCFECIYKSVCDAVENPFDGCAETVGAESYEKYSCYSENDSEEN